MTIANPIYDVVFKYLMEDERIAQIPRLHGQINNPLDKALYTIGSVPLCNDLPVVTQ